MSKPRPGVTDQEGWTARRIRLMHRLQALRATRGRAETRFTGQPEPRSIGEPGLGRQLCAGQFHLAGALLEAPGASPWTLTMPDAAFEAALHGFAWLDDLAAFGTPEAIALAQGWSFDWIARFGRGRGPGWTPELAGRRLIRWINHAPMLLADADQAGTAAFFSSLAQQTTFLSRRWQAARPGLPRIEALAGLIHAGLSLDGAAARVPAAAAALGRECAARIDAEGGLPGRNPEELLEVFTLLAWSAAALAEAGVPADPAHQDALRRIAPTLRALRHADGGLARFHGGGRGIEGRLDQALAGAGVRGTLPFGARAMGYARLAGGRTTVILDAAPPPTGAASANAHASTLAMEVTSGRRPLIVNCGSGAAFGAEWHRAGRATPSHSTLGIAGFSSSRLGGDGLVRRGDKRLLSDAPAEVRVDMAQTEEGQSFIGGHDGYVATHGMTHVRELLLDPAGRVLTGGDTLGALTQADRRRFEVLMGRTRSEGIAFELRFHLHPDVEASLDMGGTAVSMALRSGEIWVLRHDGIAALRLEPSVYLEPGRLRPRASRQVVLSARVVDYACQIGWTLAKAQDTPAAIRDLERDDPTHF